MAQPGADMKQQQQFMNQPQYTGAQPIIAPQVAPQMQLSERVELFLACGDNPQSNTFCCVYLKHSRVSDFQLLDKTEIINGYQNPTRWTKRFRLNYFFEEEQTLKFDLYSVTKKGIKTNKLSDHKLIGSTSSILGEIFHEPGSIIQKKLMKKGKKIKNKKTKRFVHFLIFAGKVKDVADTRNLKLCFHANNLIKADKLSLSDPYFLIIRNNNVVYGDRRNHLKTTLNPKWPPFHTNTQVLANNHPKTPITIELWDWDKKDKSGDDFLGKIITSMDQLKNKPRGIEILNDKRKKKKNKKNQFGTFDIIEYKSSSTFVDYIAGGIEMSLMVAIDFTASNQHPRDINSLHCIQDPNTGQPIISQYQHAIRIIGNIVSTYDDDQMYPVWGFGLNVPSKSPNVLHSFNLNYSPDNPEVHGIHGIEQVYINTVNAVQSNSIIMSGPTFFAPILKKAGLIAHNAHKEYMKAIKDKPNTKPKYFILLMITDGVIDDMKQTTDIIVQCANAKIPISIIIVGVGNENFTKMEILDADDEPLKDSKGTLAYRDIVQFLPFNKVASSNDMSLLAKETLAEIPSQFMSYVDAHNIEPLSKAKPKYNAGLHNTPDDDDNKNDDNNMDPPKDINYNVQSDPWLNAPVPPGWEREYDDNDRPFYVNHTTEETQWEHPAAVEFLKKLKEKEDAKKSALPQAQVNNAFGGDVWVAF